MFTHLSQHQSDFLKLVKGLSRVRIEVKYFSPHITDCSVSIKPLKQIKQVNIKLPDRELEILKAFSAKTGRRKGEVIREFIRSLKDQLRAD